MICDATLCRSIPLSKDQFLRQSALYQGILFPDELARLRAVEHRPNFVLRVLSEVVAQAEISQLERLRMDENLTFFADAVGACERILKTPIPLSYTR